MKDWIVTIVNQDDDKEMFFYMSSDNEPTINEILDKVEIFVELDREQE